MQKIYSTVYVACEENMGETRFIRTLLESLTLINLSLNRYRCLVCAIYFERELEQNVECKVKCPKLYMYLRIVYSLNWKTVGSSSLEKCGSK